MIHRMPPSACFKNVLDCFINAYSVLQAIPSLLRIFAIAHDIRLIESLRLGVDIHNLLCLEETNNTFNELNDSTVRMFD